MERLFVYGTLLDERVQSSVIDRIPKSAIGIIEGYLRLKVKNQDYPVAIPYPNVSVEGKVLSVTSEELQLLDVYEGVAEGDYVREKVPVQTSLGEIFAWIYLSGPNLIVSQDPWEEKKAL